MIVYSPTVFLRCHSRTKGDAADKRTGVWHCAFEPVRGDFETDTVFATCGGNSVCITNAENASVKTKHYSKDYNENFHAVAWTTLVTLNGRIKILAVAGLKSVLHLLHPDKAVCFAEYDLLKPATSGSKRKKDPIECMIFHPGQPSVLFGAFTSGAIHVWDIGNPRPPLYKCNLETLKTMRTRHSACALTFSAHCDMLLSATRAGAVGWMVPANALRNKENFKQRTFHFLCPNETLPRDDKDFVDSIEALGDGKMIASKCALHGCIYIWNLEEAIENQTRVVKPLHKLNWSSTDNFYMNIGINAMANVLACGDDKGNLWVYNIEEIVSLPFREHDCNNVIPWPEVRDSLTNRQKKLPFLNSDVVVNKVALNYDARYLVAVTNTNTVCIWKRDH